MKPVLSADIFQLFNFSGRFLAWIKGKVFQVRQMKQNLQRGNLYALKNIWLCPQFFFICGPIETGNLDMKAIIIWVQPIAYASSCKLVKCQKLKSFKYSLKLDIRSKIIWMQTDKGLSHPCTLSINNPLGPLIPKPWVINSCGQTCK